MHRLRLHDDCRLLDDHSCLCLRLKMGGKVGSNKRIKRKRKALSLLNLSIQWLATMRKVAEINRNYNATPKLRVMSYLIAACTAASYDGPCEADNGGKNCEDDNAP